MPRYLLSILLLLVLLTACQPAEKAPEVKPSPRSPSPTVAAAASPASAASPEPGMTMTSSGIQYQDLEPGTGLRPLFNQTVRVRYKGTLTNGIQFDTNIDNNSPPLEFTLGRGEVIKGWEMGIGGGAGLPPMRVGGRRKLIVPPKLGYGTEPYGTLPGNSTLIFDITLVGIKR